MQNTYLTNCALHVYSISQVPLFLASLLKINSATKYSATKYSGIDYRGIDNSGIDYRGIDYRGIDYGATEHNLW